MKKKIYILLIFLVGTLGFSNTGFKIWQKNFNAKIIGNVNLVPFVGGGLSVEGDYKVFRNDFEKRYLLLGLGLNFNGYSIKKVAKFDGALYSDMKFKFKAVNDMSLYVAGRFGFSLEGTPSLGKQITPNLFGGGSLGLEYNNFIVEIGANTTNKFYLGIGGTF